MLAGKCPVEVCQPAVAGKMYNLIVLIIHIHFFFFFFFFFFVPQLYLWGSPLLGEIFAYVTVF